MFRFRCYPDANVSQGCVRTDCYEVRKTADYVEKE